VDSEEWARAVKMTDTRYRLSDDGKLLYMSESGKWEHMYCSFYDHYCGEPCSDFKTDGKSCVLKCGGDPELFLELE